jgi:SNF2 family DNA or RNA helicase
LGKTIQTIAFLAAVLKINERPTNFFAKPKEDPVIVIAPASVLEQWNNEIKKVLMLVLFFFFCFIFV